MAQRVLIAHAEHDDEFAEKLVEPLMKAGYEVSHRGTVLVGESDIAEVSRCLEEYIPIVLCGTRRAAGSELVERLAHAARANGPHRLFIIQMEAGASLKRFAFSEKVAQYWQNPNTAITDLIASLLQHYPVGGSDSHTSFASIAEKRYRDLLLDTCDIISLTNLPDQDRHLAERAQKLKLRSIYIPLRLQSEVSARPEATADNGPGEKLLHALEQSRLETRRGTSHQNRRGVNRVSIGECLMKAKRMVVLGDPGAGKTTLIQWIATALLLRFNQDAYWKELPDMHTLPSPNLLPVIVRCRDLDLHSLEGSLDDMLDKSLRRAELSERDVATLRPLLRTRLEQGTALLMLDGLDEIADPTTRARFCRQIEQVALVCKDAPIIATSRIVGYREMAYRLSRGFEHLTLTELTKGEKDQFVRRWCALTESPQQRESAAAELINDIHSSDRIERLTGSPMLLTTVALVKRKVGRLPKRRFELYGEALQVLMAWRSEIDKRIEEDEALPQLEYVAYEMANRGEQQIRENELISLLNQMRDSYPSVAAARDRSPRQFLRLLESRTSILLRAGTTSHLGIEEQVYEFRHLIFQEFLAARALVDGYFPGYTPLVSLQSYVASLAGQIVELSFSEGGPKEPTVVENWREALRLSAAICSPKDTDSVLLGIVTPKEGEAGAVVRARSILALSCLADERNISPSVVEQILQRFTQSVWEIDGNRSEETAADAATLELSATRWSRVLREKLIERFLSDFSNAPARLASILGQTEALREEPSLAKWIRDRVAQLGAGNQLTFIDFCLTVMALAFSKKLRGVAVPTDILINGVTARTTAEAIASAWALSWLGPRQPEVEDRVWMPETADIYQFIPIIKDPDSHPELIRKLVGVLGTEGADTALEPLIELLAHPFEEIRASVAQALGNIKSEKASDALLDVLKDERENVRAQAGWALGRIKSKKAEQALIESTDDPSSKVREAALWALGEIKSEQGVSQLLKSLSDIDGVVRARACWALGEIKSRETVPELISRLEDRVSEVRRAAAWALGEVKSKSAETSLIRTLEHDVEVVRAQAAWTLGEIQGKAATPLLLAALDDGASTVRPAAAFALGSLKVHEAAIPLMRLLEDKSGIGRVQAAWALGEIECEAAAASLIACLIDDDPDLRTVAANSLEKIKLEPFVPQLISLLTDADDTVRTVSARLLGRTTNPAAVDALIARLTDSHETVRAGAGWALGEIGSEAAAVPLITCLRDTVQEVKAAALESLSKISLENSVPHLVALLDEPDITLRKAAVRLLGRTNNIAAAKPLIGLLTDYDATVRATAAWALGEIRSGEAAIPLIDTLQDDDASVRAQSARALGAIRSGAALAALVARLSDSESEVRTEAAQALGYLKNGEAIPQLQAALEDSNGAVRAAAAWAVGELPATSAVAPLIALLKDPDRAVRAAAAGSLDRMSSDKAAPELIALIEGTNAEDKNLLHSIAASGEEAMCGLFLPFAKNVINNKTVEGRNALHIATANGHKHICEMLLTIPTLDREASTLDGHTALHVAVIKGHVEIIRLLLEANAELNAKSSTGRTALHFAAQLGLEDICKLLLFQPKINVMAKTNAGRTALTLAVDAAQHELVALLKEYEDRGRAAGA
jgi:HEAT repeat protein